MRVTVGILYTRDDGTPLRVAEVHDPHVLQQVAAAAIRESRGHPEAAMLYRALELLLPSESI